MAKSVKERMKLWRERHPGIDKQVRDELRVEVLTYYGDGKCSCVHCGFNDIRALSLDHINGREMNDLTARVMGVKVENSEGLYRRLRREGFPQGYQTLCMNCQWIKRHDNNEC